MTGAFSGTFKADHLKELCHAIFVSFFKKQKGVFISMNSKSSFVIEDYLMTLKLPLSSVATDDRDGKGLKLEKNWTSFYKFLQVLSPPPPPPFPDKIHLISSSEVYRSEHFVCEYKALSNDFSTELT